MSGTKFSFVKIAYELTDERIKKLTYLQLCSTIEEVGEMRDKLAKENFLLDKFVQSVFPKIVPTLSTKSTVFTEKIAESEIQIAPVVVHQFVSMPIEEKCEIAMTEIEEIKEKIRALHEKYYKTITPYKVKLEELALRKRDLQQDMNDFNRDVILEGVNVATGSVMTEKVYLYFDRSIKSKDIQLERFRINMSTLRAIHSKLGELLKQKEELGDSLREVDFNQLKIENMQFMDKVEDRNQALLKVKYLMALSLQILGQQKMRLRNLIQSSKDMKEEIELRNNSIKAIAKEIEEVNQERNILSRRIKNLKYQLGNYRVPGVIDYVNKQAEVFDLKKNVSDWTRRVGITQRSLDIQSKLWESLKKNHKVYSGEAKADNDDNYKITNVETTEETGSEYGSVF